MPLESDRLDRTEPPGGILSSGPASLHADLTLKVAPRQHPRGLAGRGPEAHPCQQLPEPQIRPQPVPSAGERRATASYPRRYRCTSV